MKARLHHVGIAVRDLDVSVPIYEKLYDTRFRRAGAAISGPSGLEVAACWRVGIELTTPIAGSSRIAIFSRWWGCTPIGCSTKSRSCASSRSA